MRAVFPTLPGFLLFGAGVALIYPWLDDVIALLFSDPATGGNEEGVGTQGLRIVGRSALAGLVGGLLFSLTIDICAWDSCSAPWKILPFTSGWIVWQGLICAAMYLGLRRDDASGP